MADHDTSPDLCKNTSTVSMNDTPMPPIPDHSSPLVASADAIKAAELDYVDKVFHDLFSPPACSNLFADSVPLNSLGSLIDWDTNPFTDTINALNAAGPGSSFENQNSIGVSAYQICIETERCVNEGTMEKNPCEARMVQNPFSNPIHSDSSSESAKALQESERTYSDTSLKANLGDTNHIHDMRMNTTDMSPHKEPSKNPFQDAETPKHPTPPAPTFHIPISRTNPNPETPPFYAHTSRHQPSKFRLRKRSAAAAAPLQTSTTPPPPKLPIKLRFPHSITHLSSQILPQKIRLKISPLDSGITPTPTPPLTPPPTPPRPLVLGSETVRRRVE